MNTKYSYWTTFDAYEKQKQETVFAIDRPIMYQFIFSLPYASSDLPWPRLHSLAHSLESHRTAHQG